MIFFLIWRNFVKKFTNFNILGSETRKQGRKILNKLRKLEEENFGEIYRDFLEIILRKLRRSLAEL